jgi:hypothetical protein
VSPVEASFVTSAGSGDDTQEEVSAALRPALLHGISDRVPAAASGMRRV